MVELIYDDGCPNVAEARARLLRAFARVALPPLWHEWSRSDPECPPHARRLASPTVLVDGRDVEEGTQAVENASCRIYRTGSGRLEGVPSEEAIARALQSHRPAGHGAVSGSRGGSRGLLGVLPASLLAFLPVGFCAACWPAYLGFLATLGLGFLATPAWSVPLTSASLAVALGALGWGARARRGFGPLALGVVASILVLTGKFLLASGSVANVGIVLLVSAALWNAWPRRAGKAGSCPACRAEAAPLA